MAAPCCPHGVSMSFCSLCEQINTIVEQVSSRVETKTLDKMGIIPYSHPYNPTFSCMDRRRASYRTWIFSQDSNALAEAGFYYSGVTDLVTCFHCGVEIAFWMPDDVPLEEHKKLSPDCFYLRVGKFENMVPSTEVTEDAQCKFCLLREKDIIFNPCGHFMSCRVCIFQIKECGACRNTINGIQRVFPC